MTRCIPPVRSVERDRWPCRGCSIMAGLFWNPAIRRSFAASVEVAGRADPRPAGICACHHPTPCVSLRAMPDESQDHDPLTLRQLKQAADSTPQPYRVQAQVEVVTTRETREGKPFL